MLLARTITAFSSENGCEHHGSKRAGRIDKFLAGHPSGERKNGEHKGRGHQYHSHKKSEGNTTHKQNTIQPAFQRLARRAVWSYPLPFISLNLSSAANYFEKINGLPCKDRAGKHGRCGLDRVFGWIKAAVQ